MDQATLPESPVTQWLQKELEGTFPESIIDEVVTTFHSQGLHQLRDIIDSKDDLSDRKYLREVLLIKLAAINKIVPAVERLVNSQTIASSKTKVFNCPIHGHVRLSGLSVAIIDTPQFQRLRDISQLGGVYYVFPGASSKRFEHSIGVAHLARVFVNKLRQQQPELDITDADALSVEVAGLCHDIGLSTIFFRGQNLSDRADDSLGVCYAGHGPFSHCFDGRVLPRLGAPRSFHHEHASIGIFDILVEENSLMPIFREYGLDESDVQFIKELILGDPSEGPAGFEWKGRGDKTFLYDIVANKRNGIDVDRFDYFNRDCHVLGVTKSFDDTRLMEFARVHRFPRRNPDGSRKTSRTPITPPRAGTGDDDKDNDHGSTSSSLLKEIDEQTTTEEIAAAVTSTGGGSRSRAGSVYDSADLGHLEICFHVKEVWNIFELFHTRYTLHKRAYHHKVSVAVELMISEALVKADPYFFVPGKDGQLRRLSESWSDFHMYWKLSEYILRQIENSMEEGLAASRDIIKRLRTRDLFACAAEVILTPEEVLSLGSKPDAVLRRIVSFKNLLLRGDTAGASEGSAAVAASASASAAGALQEDEGEEGKREKGANSSIQQQSLTSINPNPGLASQVALVGDDDLFCTLSKIGYGKGTSNPVLDSTHFYQPNKNMSASSPEAFIEGFVEADTVSRLMPKEYEETYLRIFCRHKRQKQAVGMLFSKWFKATLRRSVNPGALTPSKRKRQSGQPYE